LLNSLQNGLTSKTKNTKLIFNLVFFMSVWQVKKLSR